MGRIARENGDRARFSAKKDVRVIRKCSERGWPLGGDSTLSKFEKTLGRRVHPLRRGRPAKKNESNT